MSEEVYDVRAAMAPKSDQLNADDLIAGPITVQITGIRLQKVTGEKGQQPLDVQLSAPYKPWRPCKSMMRVLSDQWGSNAAKWIGRWVTLYRDPSVKFGGDSVGGIRVSHMSHIPKRATLAITLTRGQRAPYHVEPLTTPSANADAPDLPWLLGWLKAGTAKGWTPDAIAELLRTHGSPDGKAATLPADARRTVAAIVKEPPPRVVDEGPPPWSEPEPGVSPWEDADLAPHLAALVAAAKYPAGVVSDYFAAQGIDLMALDEQAAKAWALKFSKDGSKRADLDGFARVGGGK